VQRKSLSSFTHSLERINPKLTRGVQMAVYDIYNVRLAADLRAAAAKSIRVTLSGTAGTVTSVAVPSFARGLRVRPGATVRLAIDEDPAAEATSSAVSVAESAMAAGAYALANEWEVRVLEDYAQKTRTLRLIGAAGSEQVYVEFF
jgi:hypothetical protein